VSGIEAADLRAGGFQDLVPGPLYLCFRLGNGAAILNHQVGVPTLFGEIHLGPNPGGSRLWRQMITSDEPHHLDGWFDRDDPDLIDLPVKTALNEQGYIENDGGLTHLPMSVNVGEHAGPYSWVNKGLEYLEPRRIRKDDLPKCKTVQGAIWVDDCRSELGGNSREQWRTGSLEFMDDGVGVNDGRPQYSQIPCHRGLAGRNRAS
jgi:hypothetical protein